MRTAALLLTLLPALQAAAQEPLETKLVVTQGGQEIGREEFTLRQSRGRGKDTIAIVALVIIVGSVYVSKQREVVLGDGDSGTPAPPPPPAPIDEPTAPPASAGDASADTTRQFESQP